MDAIVISDGHALCVRCLGEGHIPAKCTHCAKLRVRTRQDRDLHLKLIFMEKSLQPISESDTGEKGRVMAQTSTERRKRALTSLVKEAPKIKQSLARSLLPVPSISQESCYCANYLWHQENIKAELQVDIGYGTVDTSKVGAQTCPVMDAATIVTVIGIVTNFGTGEGENQTCSADRIAK